MYQITDYSKEQAKRLNVIIQPSTLKKYKIDVFDKNGDYITSIGDNKYLDYPNYIIKFGKSYADERRRLYRIRHKVDRVSKNSRGYFASEILW